MQWILDILVILSRLSKTPWPFPDADDTEDFDPVTSFPLHAYVATASDADANAFLSLQPKIRSELQLYLLWVLMCRKKIIRIKLV